MLCFFAFLCVFEHSQCTGIHLAIVSISAPSNLKMLVFDLKIALQKLHLLLFHQRKQLPLTFHEKESVLTSLAHLMFFWLQETLAMLVGGVQSKETESDVNSIRFVLTLGSSENKEINMDQFSLLISLIWSVGCHGSKIKQSQNKRIMQHVVRTVITKDANIVLVISR